ncbi:expressed unknown protein [Seminavis robusta]|uniref:Mpv17-like protein n=1 Tax=Seminavis robusta TaxID=568900 RepID=A0A9N8HLK6_9STRA|nr:expressed unknown protein [Seminavis robusta]|eukprot:Sro923_g220750.1 n/a (234) ;mRNA; f:27159-27860
MDTFWQTCPYTAAALVCGVKASAADMIAQKSVLTPTQEEPTVVVEVEEEFDLDVKRNVAFLLYGSLYQGMVHEFVFNHLYPVWFGTGIDLQIVLTKVSFNLFIQTTLVTLPVAYILKALVNQVATDSDSQQESTSTQPAQSQPQLQVKTQEPKVLQSAFDKYWHDIQHQNLLGKCFAIWGPVQCLTFTVIPEHYRVTFIAMVSFFWLIILSQISSNDEDVHAQQVTTTVQKTD